MGFIAIAFVYFFHLYYLASQAAHFYTQLQLRIFNFLFCFGFYFIKIILPAICFL